MKKVKELTIIDCLTDNMILGVFLDDPQTWKSWFTFLRAFFALRPARGDLKLYRECTGRSVWPESPAKEAWLPIGVRGGKSYMISLLAIYLAFFRKYTLSKGETGHVLIVAPTRKQAGIIKGYVSGMLHDHPGLKPHVANETQEEILLDNNVAITTLSSDFKSLRGFTGVAAIVDEVAYMNIEGSKPDVEVIRALRTRLLTTNGPLIAIGSPYAKKGTLYKTYRKHFGVDDSPTLVWKAPSRTMNPSLPKDVIDRAMKEDPAAAQADYLAEFRSDIETFINREVVDKLIHHGRYELLPMRRIKYQAFVDPAGGSGQDSMTLAIAHRENEMRVLDAIRSFNPPFSPDHVVREFAEVLRQYKVNTVVGDRFAGLWPAERFEKYGIEYEAAGRNKSDIYRDFLPLLNSGTVVLLDNELMVKEICNLERRTARGGRDFIDHPPGQHDDIANVVAGVLTNEEKTIEAGAWGSEYESGFSRFRQLPVGIEIRREFVPGDKQTPGGFLTKYGDDVEFNWK